jgi:hypothetical protein
VTDPDLLLAVGPVLSVLGDLGVRHHVAGSIASSAHGIARASVDADVFAEPSAPHVNRLIAALRDSYYVPEDRVRDAVARRASLNVIHLATMLKVDVFVSCDRPFDRGARVIPWRPSAEGPDDRARVGSAGHEGIAPARSAGAEVRGRSGQLLIRKGRRPRVSPGPPEA